MADVVGEIKFVKGYGLMNERWSHFSTSHLFPHTSVSTQITLNFSHLPPFDLVTVIS